MKFLPKSNRIPAVTVRELVHHVAETFDRVEQGEAILVIRSGRPIATIQPLEQFVVRRALERRVQRDAEPESEVAEAAVSVPIPDLTNVQWAVLEGVAAGEHSDGTINKIGGDVGAYSSAMGHLELHGFIARRSFRWEPSLTGLEALDARNGDRDVS